MNQQNPFFGVNANRVKAPPQTTINDNITPEQAKAHVLENPFQYPQAAALIEIQVAKAINATADFDPAKANWAKAEQGQKNGASCGKPYSSKKMREVAERREIIAAMPGEFTYKDIAAITGTSACIAGSDVLALINQGRLERWRPNGGHNGTPYICRSIQVKEGGND